jgi:spermidine synthase
MAEQILDYKALPHLSKINHTVAMIGTSGGEDSLYALMMGAREVVGIEMDPTIARLVMVTYHDFAGGLFTDGKYSSMVVDEGRSYLRRTTRKFDVIQQINNFTPIAFQNDSTVSR